MTSYDLSMFDAPAAPKAPEAKYDLSMLGAAPEQPKPIWQPVQPEQMQAATTLASFGDATKSANMDKLRSELRQYLGDSAPMVSHLNFEDAQRQLQRAQMDHVLRDSPHTARWFTEQVQQGKTPYDVGTLANIERVTRVAPLLPYAAARGAYNTLGGLAAAPGGFADVIGQALEPVFGKLPKSELTSIGNFITEYGRKVTGTVPEDLSTTEKGLVSGVESLGANLTSFGMAPFGLQATLATMSTSVGGSTYLENLKATGNSAAALLHGILDAGYEYIFEKAGGTSVLFDKAAWAKSFLGGVAKFAAKEIPSELVTTVAQKADQYILQNPERTFEQFMAEMPEDLAVTAIATLVGGGGQVAIFKGVEALASLGNTTARAQAAHENLTALLDNVAKAELYLNDPESFAQFFQGVAGDTTVTVDPVKLVEALTAAGITEDALPSLKDQLNAPGEVELTVQELATAFAGTGAEKALLEHVRPPVTETNPDPITLAESKEQTKAAFDTFQAAGEKAMARFQADEVFNENLKAVKDEIVADVLHTGRTGKHYADGYGTLMAHFYATMAKAHGVTPLQIRDGWTDAEGVQHRGYNPRVVGPTGQVRGRTPAVATDFKPGRVANLLNRDNWAVLEAGNPNGVEATPEENAAAMAKLKAHLDKEGIEYYDAKGSYFGTKADSLMLLGVTPQKASEIGNLFGQESVVTRHGLVFGDGTVAQATGVKEVKDTEAEDHTFLPAFGSAFRLDIPDASFENKVKLDEVLNQSVSTRTPTQKAGRADPHLTTDLDVDYSVVEEDEDLMGRMAAVVKTYPGIRKGLRNPNKIVEAFIKHVEDNLSWLYDNVPPEIRERSKLWYDGGRRIIERWVDKYGFTDAQIAGVIAVLSPQTEWDMNVTRAERILDIWTQRQDFTWSDEMNTEADSIDSIKPVLREAIRGKKLSELDSDLLRGVWIRVYDQAHNPRVVRGITPEGGFAEFKKTKGGKEKTSTWGSFAEIGKAVRILRDGSIPSISRSLGSEHKVRNFYNNLFDPTDSRSVTIDTHAVAAGLLRPLAGGSIEVSDNLGAKPRHDATGTNGTYVLYAEAYRRVAMAKGVLPRELQSITWEAVRRLFPDNYKSDAARAQIDALWKPNETGKESADEIRSKILEDRGGTIPNPAWERSGSGLDAGQPSSTYQGGVLERSWADGTPGTRSGGYFAQTVPATGKPAGLTVTGVHFSPSELTELLPSKYGKGLEGAERARVMASKDARIKRRTHFYVSTGQGVFPESGVGGKAHVSELTNLYDADVDALGLFKGKAGEQLNAAESAVLDAGYAGYVMRGFGNQGAAVVFNTTPIASYPTAEIDDDLLSIALKETKKAPSDILSDLDEDAQGVLVGRPRRLDREVSRGTYSFEDVASAWSETRGALRAKYGGVIVLYRADAPEKERHPDTKTVFFADEATAKKYEGGDRKAAPYAVRVDDILAIYARPSGYYEIVVKLPEGGLSPLQKTRANGVIPTKFVGGAAEANVQATPMPAAQYSDTQRLRQVLVSSKDLPHGAMTAAKWREYIGRVLPDILPAIEASGAFERVQGMVYRDELARAIEPPEGQFYQGGWYSPLSHAFENAKQAAMPGAQWASWLASNKAKLGLKDDEINFSGLTDYLSLRGKDKVTKSEIVDYLSGNGVRVEDVVKGTAGLDTGGGLYVGKYGYAEWAIYREDDGDSADPVGGTYSSKEEAESDLAAMLGDQPTKFASYWEDSYKGGIPGTYREILVTLPGERNMTLTEVNNIRSEAGFQPMTEQEYLTHPDPLPTTGNRQFTSTHWQEPNVLVHVRLDEVMGEVQSDWGQQGKKEGFGDQRAVAKINARISAIRTELANIFAKHPDSMTVTELPAEARPAVEALYAERKSLLAQLPTPDTVSVPPVAPFVTDTKAWVALGLKRAIMHAASAGADGIVFGTGEQNANLYDLSKKVDRLDIEPYGIEDGVQQYRVTAMKDGARAIDRTVAEPKLPSVVGKDIAKEAIAGKTRFEGKGLRVGGEGMRAFYDKIVPQVANDVLKKLGGEKVQNIALNTGKLSAESRPDSVIKADGDGYRIRLADGNKRGIFKSKRAAEDELIAQQTEYDLSAKGQPGFPITYEMREKVQAGMPLFQKVWHGTPNIWAPEPGFPHGRPRLDFMGTGEGAQAYGWGWYSAEAKDVASGYSGPGKHKGGHAAETRLVKRMERATDAGRYGEALAIEELLINRSPARARARFKEEPGNEQHREALRVVEELAHNYEETGLYQLDIPDATLPFLLDWDRPLSEQTPEVREALAAADKNWARQINGDESAPKFVKDFWPASGAELYKQLSNKLNRYPGADFGDPRSDKAASEYLASLGIVGNRYLDGQSRADGTGTYNFVIWDQPTLDRIALLERNGEKLDAIREAQLRQTQTSQQGPLGGFNPNTMEITLLANSNLSTFLHETGHFFLTAYADMAAQEGAPQQVVDDMGAILKWFGVADLATWNAMSVDQQRPYHEQFAESFEQYLFSGKAPTRELQSLFQRFAKWLTRVYGSIKEFVAGHPGAKIDPEMAAVMDRMLATETEIAAAEDNRNYEALFRTAAEAGMTPAQFAAYLDLPEEARAQAEEQLRARSMRDMKWLQNRRNRTISALQKEAAAARAEVHKEVVETVAQEPIFRAMRWLKRGELTNPDTGEEVKVTAGNKLSIPALEEMYPEGALGDKPDWRSLGYGQYGMLAKDGLHPDIVAEMFGFDSGAAMVDALLNAPKFKDEVEGLTDQIMLERHGDLSSPDKIAQAADEAIHNEVRTKIVATELSFLDKMTGSPSFLIKAAKEYARQLVANRTSKTLKAWVFAADEVRAGKAAAAALKKGDTKLAASHKRTELLNHAAVCEAHTAEKEIKAIADRLRKLTSYKDDDSAAKSRDMDMVNAVRAILFKFGFGTERKGKTAMEYLSLVEANDPAMGAVLRDLVESTTDNAKDWRTLKLSELRDLRDAVDAVWAMAKRAKLIEIDGKLVPRRQIEQELYDRLDEIGIPDRLPGEGQAVTEGERNMMKFSTFVAALRRVESWAEAKDGKAMGPFRKYIWSQIKDAADTYRVEKARYLKAYRELLDTISPTLKRELIDAREIGYTFGKGKGGMGKTELLHAILHTGNASNKRKLLMGRGWATDNGDGTLDTSKWDAFIARMIQEGKLTKADYDFAQGVWDLLDSMKPAAQKAHRASFGRYFAEVTADAFTTPFGDYRGGYVPAQADPEIVQDAQLRDLANQENENMVYAFPTTPKGFTKSRVEYNRPLRLDLRSLAGHIDKVLLFSYLTEPVSDVRRVIMSKTVSQALGRVDPKAIGSILTPWLNRVAKQVVEERVPGREPLSRFWSTVRSRAGMSAMFANITNSAQQVTGVALAAVKVRPKYLLESLAHNVMSPRKLAAQVAEMSPYMRDRMQNEIMQMGDAIDEILLNPTLLQSAKAWASKHAYFMQMAVDNTLSPMIWMGAFNQAKENGSEDLEARRLADSAVRQTQGSQAPEDIAAFESGTAFYRMFVQFAGYFNMNANLLGTEFVKIARDMGLKKGAGRGLYVLALGFYVPAVLGELIVQAFRGGPDDDDKDGEYLDDWLAAVFGYGPARYLTAMAPVVGQAANAMVNTLNHKPYDDRISTAPAISMIESAVKAPISVYKAIVDEGKVSKAVNDVATLISMTVGVPARAVAKPISYLAGAANEEIAPEDTLDAIRGTITGTASPASKQ